MNKETAAIRLAVMKSFDRIGGWEYLVRMAEEQPAAYMTLLGKVLPPEPVASSTPNVLVLRWVTPEIAQARGMIEMTANSKEPGQD